MEIAMRTTAKTAKRRRGRPRQPEHTALISALIARQDAMSARTYDKIAEIRRTYIRADHVAIAARRIRRQVRTAFLVDFPARVASQLPIFAAPDTVTALKDLLEEALEPLGPDDGGPLPEADPEEGVPPAAVTRSRTLAAARAQSAQLHAYLITLRQRILPPWRARQVMARILGRAGTEE
jgi:hypothetical protein